MATRNSKTASATKSTGRRTGRPTNAERQALLQSKANQFITIAAAAYAEGMKAALGIEGGVQTLASLPQGIGQSSGIGISQGSQSQSAASQSTSAKVTTLKTKKAPGRKVEADSKMSLTRDFYAENLKASSPLNRADFVRKAAEKFQYSKETANTYVSNIEKEGGYKLDRRGGTGAARDRSRSNGRSTSASAAKSATA